VPRDLRRAIHWYRIAALQGDGESVDRLAALPGRLAVAAE
jgi:TPR repeat protein